MLQHRQMNMVIIWCRHNLTVNKIDSNMQEIFKVTGESV